jgi:hypothetical protein
MVVAYVYYKCGRCLSSRIFATVMPTFLVDAHLAMDGMRLILSAYWAFVLADRQEIPPLASAIV